MRQLNSPQDSFSCPQPASCRYTCVATGKHSQGRTGRICQGHMAFPLRHRHVMKLPHTIPGCALHVLLWEARQCQALQVQNFNPDLADLCIAVYLGRLTACFSLLPQCEAPLPARPSASSPAKLAKPCDWALAWKVEDGLIVAAVELGAAVNPI